VSLALFVSGSSIYAYPSPIALSATYSYHYLSLSLLLPPPQHLLYRSPIGGSLYFVCASFPLAIAYASRQASKQASNSPITKCKPRHTLPASKQACRVPYHHHCCDCACRSAFTARSRSPAAAPTAVWHLPSLELLVESAYNAMPLHRCSHFLPSRCFTVSIPLPLSHSYTHSLNSLTHTPTHSLAHPRNPPHHHYHQSPALRAH